MIHRSEDRRLVEKEFIRMGFDKDTRWRISDINKDFALCNTYPRFLIVPASFKDEDLESVAKFRYFRRIPTAVWRHIKNGCFIVRSSQPTVGWFGWFRSELDESLVQSYVSNTMPPNGDQIDLDITQDDSIESVDDLCDQHTIVNGGDDDDLSDDARRTPQNEDSSFSADQQCEERLHYSHNNIQKATEVLNHGDETKLGVIELNRKELDHNPQVTDTTSPYNFSLNFDSDTNAKANPDLDDRGADVDANPNTYTYTFTNSNYNNQHLESSLDVTNHVDTETSSPAPHHDQHSVLRQNGANSSSSSSSAHDNSTSQTLETNEPLSLNSSSKMLIIDARSYTAAMANRAKGGGCECSEYYLRCEVQFMNLANIHSIRKSFHAIRSVCEAYSEQSNNWVNSLDNSRWLHHISGLLKSASLIVETIDVEEKSILIHCSDGWDRTPQLVALAEIMLDPYYRTFEGFRTLIQREWLDFGHKFADRCGSNPCNEDPNERCPVFLQWLDCVQQLLVQYPKHFEFNSLYLDKLNRHTYSNVFGTFSYNSTQERILSRIEDRVLSLWSYLYSSRRRFRNDKYVETFEILRPSARVRDLHFWKEVYLPPLGNQRAYKPIANNIDNKKFYDSLYIDSFTRTVCK